LLHAGKAGTGYTDSTILQFAKLVKPVTIKRCRYQRSPIGKPKSTTGLNRDDRGRVSRHHGQRLYRGASPFADSTTAAPRKSRSSPSSSENYRLAVTVSLCSQTWHLKLRKSFFSSIDDNCTSHIGAPHVGHGGWSSGLLGSVTEWNCGMAHSFRSQAGSAIGLSATEARLSAPSGRRFPSMRFGLNEVQEIRRESYFHMSRRRNSGKAWSDD